jgi:hypothetical protein
MDVLSEILQRHSEDSDTIFLVFFAADMVGVDEYYENGDGRE